MWSDAVFTGRDERVLLVCVQSRAVTGKTQLIYHHMLWNLPGVRPLCTSALTKKVAQPIGAYIQRGGPGRQPIRRARFGGAACGIDEGSKS